LLGNGLITVGLWIGRVAQILMALCSLAIIVAGISALLGESEFPGPFTLSEPVGFGTYAWQVAAMIAGLWIIRATVGVGLLFAGRAVLPQAERDLMDAVADEAQRQGII
jgi:hypothetical protein